MSLTNNILNGLFIPGQIPLDAKGVVPNTSYLLDLGINTEKPYYYYEGLVIYCVEERLYYEWREVTNTSTDLLLPESFTYPNNIVSNGITYSNRVFNFHLKPQTLAIASIGTNTPVYKGYNIIELQHEFYSLISQKSLELTIINQNSIRLEILENIIKHGGGLSIYKEFDNQEKKHILYDIYSDTLNLSIKTINNKEVFTIEIPESSSIPSLYVNQDYKPTYKDWFDAGGNTNPSFLFKGLGSLSKPFTNSINYTNTTTFTITSNTAIANAIEAYIGTGTVDNPQKGFQYIVVQASNTQYLYDGDFTIRHFRLRLEPNAYVKCTKSTGYIIDMDNNTVFPNTGNSYDVVFYLDSNSTLEVKVPFRNSGSSLSSNNFAISKILYIKGNKGNLVELEPYTSGLAIFDADSTGTKNYNNDGNLSFDINNVIVYSRFNTIAKIGGLSKINFNQSELSSSTIIDTVNVNLPFIEQNGGLLRFFDCIVSCYGGGVRLKAFKFTPPTTASSSSSIYKPNLVIRNTRFIGYAGTWFYKENNYFVGIDILNCTSLYFTGNQLFDTSGASKWYITLRNNVFEQININFNKLDLTNGNNISSSNTIGNNVIETLVKYGSRTDAINGGLPLGAKFINTNGMNINTPDPSWKLDIVI